MTRLVVERTRNDDEPKQINWIMRKEKENTESMKAEAKVFSNLPSDYGFCCVRSRAIFVSTHVLWLYSNPSTVTEIWCSPKTSSSNDQCVA